MDRSTGSKRDETLLIMANFGESWARKFSIRLAITIRKASRRALGEQTPFHATTRIAPSWRYLVVTSIIQCSVLQCHQCSTHLTCVLIYLLRVCFRSSAVHGLSEYPRRTLSSQIGSFLPTTNGKTAPWGGIRSLVDRRPSLRVLEWIVAEQPKEGKINHRPP